MSLIRIKCSSCGVKLEVPENLAGQPVQCSACGTVFQAERSPSLAGKMRVVGVRIVKTAVVLCILALMALAGTGVWLVTSESQKRDDIAKKLIAEKLSEHPLEIADVDLLWADIPGNVDIIKAAWAGRFDSEEPIVLSASGDFVVKANMMEKLYQPVSQRDGFQELKITETYEKELADAREMLPKLPVSLQNDLRGDLPRDMPLFRFQKALVAKDERVELTGSVSLVKDVEKIWQEDHIQIDPLPFGNTFTPESKLQNVHKLDDPATKRAVETVIQARKNFISKIDETVAGLKNRDDVAIQAVKKELSDPTLEVFNDSAIAVKWTSETAASASGTFSAKTKTKEKLYQSVDMKDGLRELGMTAADDREFNACKERVQSLPKPYGTDLSKKCNAITELKELRFYRVRAPKGEDVTRTGSVELSMNSNKEWMAKVQVASSDNFILESELSTDTFKLDDPRTKETVESIIRDRKNFVDLLKPISDFDEFCKPGKKYEGSYEAFNESAKVRVAFESDEKNTDMAVQGTISFIHSRGQVNRPFAVSVKMGEKTGYPIVGEIDNNRLPAWLGFLESLGTTTPEQRSLIRNYYSTLERYTLVEVQFTDDEMTFSVDCRQGFSPLPGGPGRLKIEFGITRAKPVPQEVAGVPLRSTPATVTLSRSKPSPIADAIDLNEELKKHGFEDLNKFRHSDFLQYGSTELRGRLREAEVNLRDVDPLDGKAKKAAEMELNKVQAEIKAVQDEFAEKTFFGEYSYTISNERSDGDSSGSFSMDVPVKAYISKIGKVSFPIPNVKSTNADYHYGGGIRISASGNSDNLRELRDNRDQYRAKVWFTNFRYDSAIEITKIEIIKKD